MKTKKHRIVLVLLISAAILVSFVCVSRYIKAIAHDALISHHSITPAPTLQLTHESASQEPQAQRVALERYQFLNRISTSFGYLPLDDYSGDTTSEDVVIFPAGTSDRLYLFLRDFNNTDQGKILCYQHSDGKDRLVYDIVLTTLYQSPPKIARPQSLLDYIRSNGVYRTNDDHSYTLPASISLVAKEDLTLNRTYVEYHCAGLYSSLNVSLLRNDYLLDDTPIEGYSLDVDPFTKASLKDDEFYQRYGLPVASKEQFNGHSQQSHEPEPLYSVPFDHPRLETQTKKLSHERYQFLERLMPDDLIPLDKPAYSYDTLLFPTKSSTAAFQTSFTALFPRRRSDRVYLFYWNDNEDQSNVICCYQHKRGKTRLVYTIDLKTVGGQVQKLTRIDSLQDYLRSCETQTTVNGITREAHYAIEGKVSPSIKRDLTMACGYVQYSYDALTNALEVWLLFDPTTGHPSSVERYYLPEESRTQGSLEQDAFFSKYGLPTAKEE